MNRIKNMILYGGLTKEAYDSISDEKYQYNLGIWKTASLIAWCISVYLVISSFTISDLAGNQGVYIALFGLSTLLGAVMRFGRMKGNHFVLNVLISAYFTVFLSFGIFLGVMQSLDQMTVTFHVLMISLPLIVILSPLHVFIMEFVMLCAFCIICALYKLPAVLSIDIFNGITFFIVAQVMYYMTLRTKLNEHLLRKKIEYISFSDSLTGLYNRNAYNLDLEELSKTDLDKDLVYYSLDVNGLKKANDTLGHAAGDEIICGAASCMHKVFSGVGKVYRVGGDEMVAIVKASEGETEKLSAAFRSEVSAWKGSFCPTLSVSLGLAAVREFPGEPIEGLAKISDARMYEDKARYYESLKHDR